MTCEKWISNASITLTLKVLVTTIDALQYFETGHSAMGMGEVGSARYEPASSPSIKVLATVTVKRSLTQQTGLAV